MMIKKYVILISAILAIAIFISTSSASILSTREKMLERIHENAFLNRAYERILQISSNNDNSVDSGSSREGNSLQETIDIDGNVTPDNGNKVVVEENDLGDNTTIDINGKEGTTLNDKPIVDENGEVGITNGIIVKEEGENGNTIDKIIEIVTEHNVVLGTALQRVVEHTFAPGTTESVGVSENIVDTVMVVGDSGGTAENNIVHNVVLTANGQ